MVPKEFYEKKVKEIMKSVETKEVPIIVVDASIDDVLKMLRTKNHVWIVNNQDDKKLLGIITDKDFLTVISPIPRRTWVTGVTVFKTIQQRELKTAENLMTRNPISCKPEDEVEKALDLMGDHGINRLAVVESKKLVGEIALNTILEWYSSCSLLK
ncbi:MAG: CBS domain-containing protein [Candidatus Thermoplasmatota archaeon]|nr:CBS domain-containing protein [Candidatus Thermoplasmatota archaeon]